MLLPGVEQSIHLVGTILYLGLPVSGIELGVAGNSLSLNKNHPVET